MALTILPCCLQEAQVGWDSSFPWGGRERWSFLSALAPSLSPPHAPHFLLLLVEMGFLRCHEKSISGPRKGGQGVMVRLIEAVANTKDCPQVPGVCASPTAGWFSSIPLWKKPSIVCTKPRRRAGVQKSRVISSAHAKA